MNTRTDIHRPSSIDPAEYVFVATLYVKEEDVIGAVYFLQQERETLRRHMAATGGKFADHEHGGSCQVCGAHAVYMAAFYHEASNVYLQTGFTCAEKLDLGDPDLFRTFRKSIADARKRQKGKAKARALLVDADLSAAWDLFESEEKETDREEHTVRDIVRTMTKGGYLSEGQEKYLRSLLDRINRREEIAAERAAERAAAKPAPTGRVSITGEVLKTEVKENRYGSRVVMTVKTSEGWIAWGSMPSGLDARRGDRVEFTAEFSPSDRDPKFAFYKRPTRSQVLKAAA